MCPSRGGWKESVCHLREAVDIIDGSSVRCHGHAGDVAVGTKGASEVAHVCEVAAHHVIRLYLQ